MRTSLLVVAALVAGFFGGSMAPRGAVAQQQLPPPPPKVDAPPAPAPNGYSLVGRDDHAGLWVHRGTSRPSAALYTSGGSDPVTVLGFNRSDDATIKSGHQFAIVGEKDGVWFQVVDDAGNVHSIPATALLKLAGGK